MKRALASAWLLLSIGPIAAGQTPTSEPAKVVWPLTKAAWEKPPDCSLAQLEKLWPVFPRESFQDAGFSPLVLPFLYADAGGQGDADEALAFSFLLSDALDWTPGCYRAYPSYLVFKRSQKQVQPLAAEYKPEAIRSLLKDWSATHAVGGTLRPAGGAYSGQLLVYDSQGWQVLARDYKDRSYSNLLADMAVDVMKFRGRPPSPELERELRRVRCRDRQSLLDLGKAAFLKEQSKEEIELCDRILSRDEDFAEVRCWRAGRQFARDGQARECSLQIARSLKSRLTPAALLDFDPQNCPDRELAGNYEAWLASAEKLVGPESPLLLRVRLEQALRQDKPVPPATLALATKAAAKYPNDYWLLTRLATVYARYYADLPMAIALDSAAMQNSYPADGVTKTHAFRQLVRNLCQLGYPELALGVIRPVRREQFKARDKLEAAWSSLWLGRAMADLGRYEAAVESLQLAVESIQPGDMAPGDALTELGICIALAGQPDALRDLLRDSAKELQQGGAVALLDAYLLACDGQEVDAKDLSARLPRDNPFWRRQELLLLAQLDDLAGRTDHRQDVIAELRRNPDCRPLWVVFDLYDRRDPQPASACFYQSLEWLHGEDPFVRSAAEDYSKRVERPQAPAPGELLDLLKDFPPAWRVQPNPWLRQPAEAACNRLAPGAVEAAVKALAEQRKFDQAEELALRYHHLAMNTDYGIRARSCLLVHKLRELKAQWQATSTSAPTTGRTR